MGRLFWGSGRRGSIFAANRSGRGRVDSPSRTIRAKNCVRSPLPVSPVSRMIGVWTRWNQGVAIRSGTAASDGKSIGKKPDRMRNRARGRDRARERI